MSHDPMQILLWNQRLQDCVASGISVRAYCRRESIASSTFYAWRKYFSDKTVVPAIASRTTVSESKFVTELHIGFPLEHDFFTKKRITFTALDREGTM